MPSRILALLCVLLTPLAGVAQQAAKPRLGVDRLDEEHAARLQNAIKQLYDPNPAMRASAVEPILAFGGMAVRPLMEVLKDRNLDARLAATEVLWRVGRRARPAVPLLIAMLAAPDPEARWSASRALSNFGPAAAPAHSKLIELLARDQDAKVRAGAAFALDCLGPKGAVPVLIKALKDPDEEVRKASATALGRGPFPDLAQSAPALAVLLKDKSVVSRQAALGALSRIKPVPPEVAAAFVDALGDPEVITPAIYACRELGIEGKAYLFAGLQHKNATARREIACMLRQFQEWTGRKNPWGTEFLPALLKAAADPDEWVRYYAAESLINLGDDIKPAVASLAVGFRDPSKYVRRHMASIQLKYAADPAPATSVFLKLFEDRDHGFVATVVDSLATCGARAVPILRKALSHANSCVYTPAGYALARSGRDAVPALLDALQDSAANIHPETPFFLYLACQYAKDDVTESKAVLAVAANLRHPSERVRALAAYNLGYFRAKAGAAVPALIKALDDRDPKVAQLAMSAIGEIGPVAKAAVPRLMEMVENVPADRPAPESIRALIADLNNDTFAVRSKATRALEKMARRAVLPLRQALEKEPSLETRRRLTLLLEKLDTQERELGVKAVMTLGGMGPEARAAVPVLLAALQDKSRSREMTVRAAGALAKIHSENPAVGAALGAMLRDKDPEVRKAVALAFEVMKSPPAVAKPALIAALSDPLQDVSSSAARALAKMGPDAADAVPALILLVRKNGGAVSEAAGEALRKVGPAAKQTIPRLIEVLQCREDKVVAVAAVAAVAAETLASFGPDSHEAIPALVRALVSSHGSVSANASIALDKIDPHWKKVATPILIEELTHAKSLLDRRHAIRELMKVGPAAKAAVPHLVPLLQNVDDDTRLAAVNALGAMGPAASAAVPRLIPLLQDDSDVVREAVAVALKKMDV